MGRGSVRGRELSCVGTGILAERLVAIEIMAVSRGRLMPFVPFVDDFGVDLLVHDTVTGNSVAVQVKSRMRNRRPTVSGGKDPCMHFDVPRVSAARARRMLLLAVVLAPDARSITCAWLFEMREMPRIALAKGGAGDAWCMRPSSSPTSRDRYTGHRHHSFEDVVQRIARLLREMG